MQVQPTSVISSKTVSLEEKLDTTAYVVLAREACRLSQAKDERSVKLWGMVEEAVLAGRVNAAELAASLTNSGTTILETVLQLRDIPAAKFFAQSLTSGPHARGMVKKQDGWLATTGNANSERPDVGLKIYDSGALYIGEVKDGLRDGFGHFIRPDGGGHLGMWKKDKQHGEGRQIASNGRPLPGDSFFVDGCFHHYIKRPSTFSSLVAALKPPFRGDT